MNDFSSAVVGHFWSLAVEEQFYLIWAPLLFLFRKKLLLLTIAVGILGYFTTVHQPEIFEKWFQDNANLCPVFFTSNRFFHFGLGALIAILTEKKHLMELPAFVSIVLQIAFLLPFATYLFGHHYYPLAPERIVNGLLSGGLILIAITKYSILPFEIAWLKYLGRISFGIYIFHMFSIRLIFKFIYSAGIEPMGVVFKTLFPALSVLVTVGLASLSFELMEKRFLVFKNKLK
jgi:peptidoglycan/LPS O-acetylase OafA/YrhL